VEISLAITAIGAVSSVGRCVADTCAAIRAGLSRSAEVSHFGIIDLDEHELVPLQGHPISGLTDGFSPLARWLVMSRRAIGDLRKNHLPSNDQEEKFWSSCGLICVLPILDDARFFFCLPCRSDAINESFLTQLLGEIPRAASPGEQDFVAVGAAGIGLALKRAAAWIAAGKVERVLVVAVDSLLDAWSLDWLAETGRLKDQDRSAGLAPGEAAVALVIEQRGSDSAPDPMGWIKSLAFEDGDNPFPNVERRQGRELAGAIRQALDAVENRIEGDIYVDLNGEDWRAAEFGSALASLAPGTLGPHQLLTAATSVGDIGAASGAMHIACALRSFERGYAASSQAWVLSSSEYGETSALCLEVC